MSSRLIVDKLIFYNQLLLLFRKVLIIWFLTFNNLFLWLNFHKMIRLVIELVLLLSRLLSYLKLFKSFISKTTKVLLVIKVWITHNYKPFQILSFRHRDKIFNKKNQLQDLLIIKKIPCLLYHLLKMNLIFLIKMLRDLWCFC